MSANIYGTINNRLETADTPIIDSINTVLATLDAE